MSDPLRRKRSPQVRVVIVAALVCVTAVGVSWFAPAPLGRLIGTPSLASEGGITLDEAVLRLTPGAWRLDARADIDLPPEIRAGLDSGVPLEFVLELAVERARPWLPDTRVFAATRRYGLEYYELTRHYHVRSLDDGVGHHYRSLSAALVGLGTLQGVTFDGGWEPAGPSIMQDGKTLAFEFELELRLDQRALPLPLQSLTGAQWRLQSERRVWPWPTPSAAARS